MDKLSFFVGGMCALALTLCGIVVIVRLVPVNITDTELYRFCLANGIALENCKIPGSMLDKNNSTKEQPHG